MPMNLPSPPRRRRFRRRHLRLPPGAAELQRGRWDRCAGGAVEELRIVSGYHMQNIYIYIMMHIIYIHIHVKYVWI